MDHDPAAGSEEAWVVHAADVEPVERHERPIGPVRAEARRAMALGLLGLVFFGFILGPMALARGKRVQLALVDSPYQGGGATAHTAMTLGKVGMALHFVIAGTALPWLLFMLPLLYGH